MELIVWSEKRVLQKGGSALLNCTIHMQQDHLCTYYGHRVLVWGLYFLGSVDSVLSLTLVFNVGLGAS